MKSTRIIVLAVALLSGLAAAFVAMRMVAQREVPEPVVAEAPRQDVVKVLVANRDFALGSTIRSDDLSWVDWPKSALTDNYVTQELSPNAQTEFNGSILKQGVLAGEPVRAARMLKSERGLMSVLLAPGMRAVAIEVKAVSSAGGFILPNDKVDIILTRAAPRSLQQVDPFVSETILTNIRVLAIDQQLNETKGESSVVARDTATLELTPKQAEIVSLSRQLGTISLALRSIRDGEVETVAEQSAAVRVVRFGVTTRVTTSN
jgi:pilus assembly protein CpaB